MRRGLLIVQSAALAAVMMCPTPGTPGARALGSADADTAKHLWNLWWMRTELLSGEPGLGTRLVNFPDGAALYPIDPLDGLVGFFLPIPAVSLANVLCFVHLTLLGMAAGWLGRMVSGSRLGGYVAAALAQGSAFAAFTVHVGVGELRQFWWLPLGLGCLLRARETGAWSWFVRLGLVGGFATVACFYYGAFLGLASVTVLAVDLVVQRAVPSLRVLRGHGLALAIAAAIAAPAASAFASSYGPSATVATTPTTTAAVTVSDASGAAATTPTTTAAVTVSDASGAAAALEDLYLPRAWARSELDDDARAYTGGRYLGFLAVALALAGVVAHPRRAAPWAGVAVVGVVLSLGSGSDGQPMPFRWLDAAFAFVTEPVNFPARFLAMTMIALPVLGALATRWRWAALLAPLAVIEIQTADLVPWPRETMALPPAGGLAGRGPVFDLGLALDDSRASRLMNVAVQMSLGSPTQAFPVDRLDRWNASGVRWARALPLVQDLRVRRARDVGPHEAYRPDVALLRDRGFERILLTHPTDGLDPQYEGIITALCGAPQRIELATLWTLPAADDGVDATMLAAWRAEQEARVDALVDEDEPGTYPTSPQQR